MHRKKTGLAMMCGATAAVLGLSLAAFADTTPKDAMKYRKNIMEAMGGHVGAISMHLRGLVEDRGVLANHSEALANAATELDYLFPEGSNVDDSEALPEIWEQPEEFAKVVANAKNATAAFNEAVAGGDQDLIGTAFRDVAKACRACHDRFRMDDD